MKETILLFHVPDKEQLLKLEMALFPLHVRFRHIQAEDYNQPLGFLAGVSQVKPATEKNSTLTLTDTMFVFAFFDDTRLNQALTAIRRSGAGSFPYKAVLTPTNQFWTAPDCLAELKREHEAMNP